jgi:hypothetical protein
MSKTLFSDKAAILADLWVNYREDAEKNEAWLDFFHYNDVALPLAYMISEDLAFINTDSDAEELIEETWKMFCNYINVDPDGEYAGIADMFLDSPQPPMSDEDGE